ncbi:hypothetical protein LDP52_04140 [Photobacterium damselae]|uniref:hypothetical protein n=1 Tax=Photobacterium damselae TaxID=38293 RepID=UPI00234065E6|nr:hypothetical protein [Photobacterium damselae]MDC4167914.1 hypothetical protein [Photobacterium damselae]
MKKFSLSVIAMTTLFSAGMAQAGDVKLNGHVAPVCEISGLTSAIVDFGDVSTAQKTGSVSGLTFKCNDYDGATVTMISAEGGLESDDAEDVALSYDAVLTIGNNVNTFNAPGGFNTNNYTETYSLSGSATLAAGIAGQIELTTTAAAPWAGGYSDTLTVAITAQ